MFVTVESAVGGDAAGYLKFTLTGNEELKTLITNYCETKGIQVLPDLILRNSKGIVLDCRKTVLDSGVENGAILYLENQAMQNEIFGFTNWWALAFGAVLVSLAGLAVIVTLYVVEGPAPKGYGVVLDGGSSHTALYVYQWDGPKWQGTGVLKQIGACNMDGDIGHLYNNISVIDTFLTPCLTYASNHVPSSSRLSTPIFFGLTAGLRLLNISQPSAAEVLLDGIRNRLSRSGFQFLPSYVEILPGKDEAQFSWVTVNTQLHSLGPNDTLYIPPNASGPETMGAMDLGGASTQIAMEVGPNYVAPSGGDARSRLFREENLSQLELYGRNYSVYSQSNLCYGVLEVIKRYESILIHEAGKDQDVIESPCHPLGHELEVGFDYVFNSPCTQNLSSSLLGPQADRRWTLNGTSDYDKCAAIVDRLFNLTYCQSQFLSQTCFSKQGLPLLDHQNFMAFSSFNYVARDLNITNSSSLDDFRSTVKRVCQMNWDQVVNLPLTVPNSSFTPLLCLESQYVMSLLTVGYGFDADSWQRIYFMNQISQVNVGWTMGYMTERTNAIAATKAKILLSTPTFIALVILFSLFLSIGFLLSFHAYRMSQASDSYSRLSHHTYGSLTMSL